MLSLHFSPAKTISIPTFDKKSNSFFSLSTFQAYSECLISGHITVQPVKSASLQIQVIGSIENYQKEENEILYNIVQCLAAEITIQEEEKNYEFSLKLGAVYESLKVTNFQVKHVMKASLYNKGGEIIEEIEREFGVQRLRDETRRIEKLSIDLHLEDIFGYIFEMNKTEYYTDEIAIAKIRILNAVNTAASMELRLLKVEFTPGQKKDNPERHEECICIERIPTQIIRKGDVFGLKVNLNLYNLPPSASFQNSNYKVTYQFRIVLVMWERFFGSSFSVKLWAPKPQS